MLPQSMPFRGRAEERSSALFRSSRSPAEIFVKNLPFNKFLSPALKRLLHYGPIQGCMFSYFPRGVSEPRKDQSASCTEFVGCSATPPPGSLPLLLTKHCDSTGATLGPVLISSNSYWYRRLLAYLDPSLLLSSQTKLSHQSSGLI